MSALAPRLTLLRHHLLAIRPNYRASLCRGFADLPPQPPKSRVDRFRARLHGYNARSPRFFQRWTTPLIDAPASHIFSFAILHEFTALVPLVGLAFLFHYTGWLPAPAEWKWAKFGVERGGKWLRKRGWINDEEVKGAKNELAAEEAQEGSRKGKWNRLLSKESRSKIWEKGEEGSKLVLEIGTAWAIVKALVVPRIVLCAVVTPWFARVAVIPVGAFTKKSIRWPWF